VAITLTADPLVVYKLGLRVRGVIDLKTFTGSTPVQKYVVSGGTPAVDNRTVVSLIITNPSITYYLNVSPTAVVPDYNVPLDYTLDVLIRGTATATLKIDNIDSIQFRGDVNGGLIDHEPIGLYDGIWLRVDTEPSEPLVEYSVATGGGIRGWLWSAFGENVYGIKAEK